VNAKGKAACVKAEYQRTYDRLTPEDGVVDLREEVVVRALTPRTVEDQKCPSDKGDNGLASEALKIVRRFITAVWRLG
jgi:hypothetical protein